MRARYADQGWALTLRGIWMYCASLACLQWPQIVEAAIATIFGIFMIADAVIGLLYTIRAVEPNRGARPVLVTEALVGIGIGIFILVRPHSHLIMVVYLIAGWMITSGALRVMAGLDLRKPMANSWLFAFSGGSAMIGGVALFGVPVFGTNVALQIFGAASIVSGTALLSLAFQMYNWVRARQDEQEAQYR